MASFELRGKRVFIAGHRGMVGSAVVRRLAGEDCEVLTVPRQNVDLRDQAAVLAWFEATRPQAVFVAAAIVGGIHANATRPKDFLFDNLAISTNVVDAAYRVGVEKLMFFGSTCIYPRLAPQPIPEDALLTDFVFDRGKPDGTPRKLVDVTKLSALGWRPRIELETGIREVYRWYLKNVTSV